jgi:hypothetical protein
MQGIEQCNPKMKLYICATLVRRRSHLTHLLNASDTIEWYFYRGAKTWCSSKGDDSILLVLLDWRRCIFHIHQSVICDHFNGFRTRRLLLLLRGQKSEHVLECQQILLVQGLFSPDNQPFKNRSEMQKWVLHNSS